MRQTDRKPTAAGARGGRSLVFINKIGLVGLVFAVNAGIMTLELVAGRLTARYLGQSLYTWTTIIGVVLAGMALGNWLGGRLTDRFPPGRLLPVLLTVAAIGCLGILALNRGMGEWQAIREIASWPIRILLHMAVTFLAPCVLLGAISPVAAAIAVANEHRTGRALGLVYAAAAAGSIGGTFVTGFYFIMVLPASAIVFATGLWLFGLAGACWWMMRNAPEPMTNTAPPPEPAAAREDCWWTDIPATVLATVFLSNAAFMIFELAASRMATEYLGHSLYTWTTLLGVVLAGITLGNYVGGRLADRFAPRKLLAVLFAAGALACVLVPTVNNWLGNLPEGALPWVKRIILHIGGAFFIPAALLGTIGPVAARKAVAESRRPGRTLGVVYAVSAVGGVVGTFAAGFYLIDTLWPLGTVLTLAFILALAGSLHDRQSRWNHAVSGVTLVALLAGLLPWAPAMVLGDAWRLRETKAARDVRSLVDYLDHSQYSLIAVTHGADPAERVMVLDRLQHTRKNIREPAELYYEYLWVYRGILDKKFPPSRPITVNLIGGGGFAFPHFLELTRPGSYIEVAEIDPAVTEAAHAAMGLPRNTSIRVFNLDARNRMEDLLRVRQAGQTIPAFDVVLGDSFNQYSVPFQLATVEFDRMVYSLLNEDGLYLFNLIDRAADGRFLGSILRTLREVFPYVNAVSTDSKDAARDTFVVIAAKRPLDLTDLAARIRMVYPFRGDLIAADKVIQYMNHPAARLLTDDLAPVDNLLASLVNTIAGNEQLTARSKEAVADEYVRVGRYAEAITAYQSLLAQGDVRPSTYNNLAVALSSQGRYAAAIPYFQTAIAGLPRSAEPRYGLADTLVAQNRLAEAVPLYEEALRLDPNSLKALRGLANTLSNLGRFEAAVGHYERLLVVLAEGRSKAESGLAPARIHTDLALALAGTGQESRAVAELTQSYAMNPADLDTVANLGALLFKAGRVDEALPLLKQATALAPESAALLGNYAKALSLAGRHEEAIAGFTALATRQPDDADVQYDAGVAFLHAGKTAAAAAQFRKVLALKPDHAAARNALHEAETGSPIITAPQKPVSEN